MYVGSFNGDYNFLNKEETKEVKTFVKNIFDVFDKKQFYFELEINKKMHQIIKESELIIIKQREDDNNCLVFTTDGLDIKDDLDRDEDLDREDKEHLNNKPKAYIEVSDLFKQIFRNIDNSLEEEEKNRAIKIKFTELINLTNKLYESKEQKLSMDFKKNKDTIFLINFDRIGNLSLLLLGCKLGLHLKDFFKPIPILLNKSTNLFEYFKYGDKLYSFTDFNPDDNIKIDSNNFIEVSFAKNSTRPNDRQCEVDEKTLSQLSEDEVFKLRTMLEMYGKLVYFENEFSSSEPYSEEKEKTRTKINERHAIYATRFVNNYEKSKEGVSLFWNSKTGLFDYVKKDDGYCHLKGDSGQQVNKINLDEYVEVVYIKQSWEISFTIKDENISEKNLSNLKTIIGNMNKGDIIREKF